MNLVDVLAEGTTFRLLLGGTRQDLDRKGIDTTPLGSQLDRHLVLRDSASLIALFPSMLRNSHFIAYYLFWQTGGIDLSALEEKVRSRDYSDDDFRAAVKCGFQKTTCLVCDQTFDTLVILPGDPYPGAPGLLREKIQNARFQSCLGCGSSLRQMVVHIFQKSSSNT